MTNDPSAPSLSANRSPSRLGLPILGVVGLALLGLPRVALHDLGLIEEGTFVNALFVFVPVVLWILVAVAKRVPSPFLTLLSVGAAYGVLLALVHQLLWGVNVDDPVSLGGNLADLDPGAQQLIIRTFAVISSLFTGLIVGAISGLVAWGVARLAGTTRPRT